MTNAENLLYMVKTDRMALGKLLDDVTDEESMVCGQDKLNHIRWLTGHLVYETNWLLAMLGCPQVALPESYKGLFDAGTEPSDDASVYPPMATLREELYDLHDRVTAALEGITDETLAQPLPAEIGFKASRLQAATFMAMHAFYHAGQIAVIRRMLGRARAFR